MPNWTPDDEDFDCEPEIERKRRVLYGTRKAQVPTWNGKPVKDMETDHIMNSILFCEKRFADALDNHTRCFAQGVTSGQPFYFDSVYEMFPDYRNLRDEWARRNRE